MRDDMEVITHDFNSKSIKVYAVADVHLGAKESNERAFKAFLDRVEKEDGSYIVLCGDIVNNATRASVSDIYEEVLSPSQQKERAYELLLHVKDKILGMVMGNHEGRSAKDVDLDPMYDVAVMLGIQHLYRKSFAFLKLKLTGADKRHGSVYTVMLMHGKSRNKTRSFAYALEGVDVLVTGHTHEGLVSKPARLCLDVSGRKPKVKVKEMTSITATSWMDYGGYGARNMYMPQTTSNPQAFILENDASNEGRKLIRTEW